MFRFTIRDLLWLMVVVGILSLWAMERQGTKLVDYWFRSSRNHGQMRTTIDEQAATIEDLNKQLKYEQNWRNALSQNAAEDALLPPPPP
jgi:hypothetical protein